MVIVHRRFLFSSARIILDDEELKKALREKCYSYITGLSYNKFDFGPEVKIKNKKTIVISVKNLSAEDFLWQSSETTRNEIRRTFKMPELFFRVPCEDAETIYRLYSDFEKEGGRIVRSKDYFQKSLLAGAYLDDRLIAAIICYDASPVLRINAIVSLRHDESIRKYISFATRRLIFELFQYGSQKKYESLDLGGINVTEKEKLGITAFKRSFGGVGQDEYTYSYASSFARIFSKFL